MKSKQNLFHVLATMSSVMAFSAASNLHADAVSWNGGTGSWDDSVNWTPNALPTSSDTALFGGTAGTVTATAAQSVLGLQFTSAGYTLDGSTLTVGTGGIDASTLSSGTTTISSPVVIGTGVQRWNVGAGATLAFGAIGTSGGGASNTYDPLGAIALISSTGTKTTTNVNGWDWRGPVGQRSGLLGPGMVIDNGDNTYDWASANGGVIGAATYYAAGTGDRNNVLVTSNTTLTLNASWASLKVSGTTFTANGSNLYMDTGIILQNGATVAGSAPIRANSDGLYLYTPDTGTIYSSIQNNGANVKKLYKAGAGTLTLSGNNTYTGATVIYEGTLALGASGSINNTSGVSLANGGTLDVSAKGAGGYTVNNLTGSGTVTGALTVSTQLAIGNSPGTIEFDDLTLGASSTYVFDLVGGDTDADLANVSGNLTINSGALLDLVQLGSHTEGDKFTLFAYETGNLTGTFSGLADGAEFTDAGGLWKINYFDTTPGLNGGTGTSFVTIVAVPEPAAALLGGLGLLTLFRRRRN